MSWSIKELDKNKTEQSISNEEARIDMCRETLDRLIKERDRYKAEADRKLNEYYERIGKLNFSIKSGEKFIEDCKNHLAKDFNDDASN